MKEDPDEYKSLNVGQREILQLLFDKVRINKEENERARHELKECIETHTVQNKGMKEA